MHDYEDRAMFLPEPAIDKASDAQPPFEALELIDRRLDPKLRLLGAVALLATLAFALFVVLRFYAAVAGTNP